MPKKNQSRKHEIGKHEEEHEHYSFVLSPFHVFVVALRGCIWISSLKVQSRTNTQVTKFYTLPFFDSGIRMKIAYLDCFSGISGDMMIGH